MEVICSEAVLCAFGKKACTKRWFFPLGPAPAWRSRFPSESCWTLNPCSSQNQNVLGFLCVSPSSFVSFAKQNALVNVICKRTSSNKLGDEGITIIRHPKNPQVVEGDYRCSHSQLPMAATRNWSIFADHVGHSAHFVVECPLPKVPLTTMACGSFRLKVVTMGVDFGAF